MEEQNEKKTYDHSFILGEETRPKIEIFTQEDSDITVKNSIFYKQYRQILSAIAEHLLLCKEGEKQDAIYSSWEFPNNIFVFAGERGSGKTSCMLTARELLCMQKRDHKVVLDDLFEIEDSVKKNQDKAKIKEKEIDIYKDILKETSFYRCEVIDPLFFDSNHNILELFIGTLFRDLMKKEEKEPQYRHDRKLLLSRFAEIRRIFPLLGKKLEFSEFGDLEQLKDLSASLELKEVLRELVRDYLEYVYKDTNGKLVLCIDDIDLDMKDGYGLVECIRRYLNMPELIILMAVKLEQLGNVIRIKYTKDFRPLLEREEKYIENKTVKGDDNYNEVVNHIVERYITKLLPLNQRIIMPSVKDLFDKDIQVCRKQGGKVRKVNILSPMKNGILEEIYKKTRLLFYNTKSQVNYIIPYNLREFCNLLHLLYNLDDVESHEGALPNLIPFKEYFYGVWCTNNLDKGGLSIIQKLRDIQDYGLINQTVIKHLKRRFEVLRNIEISNDPKDAAKDKKETKESRLSDSSMKELQNILDEENMMYNISLGDVLACLDWLGKVSYQEDDQKLFFAMKTFYTFSLYETFRKKEEIAEEKKKLTQKEVINKEILTNNEIVYGDIVNGNFLNSEYLNVAPYEKIDKDKDKDKDKEKGSVSRCRRVIDNEAISDLIKYISGKKTKTDICSKIVKENFKEELLRKIVEFFLLTTSFVVESKEKEGNSSFSQYRKRNEVYYEKNITQSRKYICFDVLSIFYNLVNVAQSYGRFDKLVLENSREVKANEEKELNKEQDVEQGQIKEQEQRQEEEQVEEQEQKQQQSGEQEQNLNEGQQPVDAQNSGGVEQVDENPNKDEEDEEPEKDTKQKFEAEILLKRTQYPLFSAMLDYIIDKEFLQTSVNEKRDYEWAKKKLVYKVSLRNIDLLEQISYRLQRKRSDGSSDSVKLFKKMFDNLAEIEISTYRNEYGTQANIKYEFFGVIRDFMAELLSPGNEEHKAIFDKIYADS